MGCGQHIAAALDGVEEGDRCKGWKTGAQCAKEGESESEVVCTPCEAPEAK